MSLTDIHHGEQQPEAAPKIIYVKDFTIEDADIRVDREGEELAAFRNELARDLSDQLIERLNAYVGAAKRLEPGTPLPNHGWLIRGDFLRVHQGSRLLRASVGFGAGATKMETHVEVIDLDRAELVFLDFDTTGGTNSEPGAILNWEPIGAGITLAVQSIGGITLDTERTARMVTAYVSEYWDGRGWPLRDDPLEAKKNPITPKLPPTDGPPAIHENPDGTKPR